MRKRRKSFRKMLTAILASSMLLNLMLASTVLAEEQTAVMGNIQDIVVNTTVTPAGQYPDTIEVTVSDASVFDGLTAENFTVAGQAAGWLTTELHDFTATISDVTVEKNVMTLTFGEFPERYVYVDHYTVTCTANEALTFVCDKETTTITPIADEFEQFYEEAEGGMDYNLYTPEETGKPMPIVIAFHGFGDNENLYHNKLAVAWADPVNQEKRPCYVLAPSFSNYMNTEYRNTVYAKVYDKVQEMIEEGKVDENRVYVVGKSFGGAATYEFLEKYPELAAGAIAMCGAANYYNGFLFPQGAEDVAKIVNVPLWIAHATTDPTVPVENGRNMYNMLVEAGSKVVHFTEYSDEEMAAAGVTEAMGNHSMEAVVLEDESYLEWLFEQTKAEDILIELPFTDVAEDDWFYIYVAAAYESGLMIGIDDTTFAPDMTMTRAQFAMILYRLADEPEVEYNAVFSDVAAGKWYTNAAIWANEAGVIAGYGNGKFGPDDIITREQMALILYRFAELIEYDMSITAELDDYADSADISDWAKTAVEWAVGNGIILGTEDGELNPKGEASRAECATFMAHFLTL